MIYDEFFPDFDELMGCHIPSIFNFSETVLFHFSPIAINFQSVNATSYFPENSSQGRIRARDFIICNHVLYHYATATAQVPSDLDFIETFHTNFLLFYYCFLSSQLQSAVSA